MTVELLAPLPKLRFVDNNGNALSGGFLFSYTAGTTTKLATYTDNTGATANANPIVLNTRGEANVWIPPGTAYKFTLAPSTDTDPPTNAFWTVDQITVGGVLAAPSTISDTSATDSPLLTISKTSTTIYTGDDNPLLTLKTAATQDATLVQFVASGNTAEFGVKRNTNNIVLKVGIGGTPIETQTWFLDGGVNVGSPTGGDQGAGTLNAAGNFYVKGVPGTLYFASSAQAISVAGQIVLAHSLVTEPSTVFVELHNVNAEAGYTAGQHLALGPATTGSANRGISFTKNATNITIRFGSDPGVFDIMRYDNGLTTTITPGNWTAVFKAYQ